MHLEDFYQLRRKVGDSGVIFYFSGDLSQTIIAAIGEALRVRLDEAGVKGSVARRVFSTFVEMVQNILNYADTPGHDYSALHHGTLAIGHQGERFYIVCGNVMGNEHVPRIREKLERLCAMSLDEIKQEYKRQLREEPEPTSKGAGLGFLTVARDASEPIEFSFHPDLHQPQSKSLFFLKALI